MRKRLRCIECKKWITDVVLLIEGPHDEVYQGRCKNPKCKLYQTGVVYARDINF